MVFRCTFSRVLGVLFATVLTNLICFSDAAVHDLNSINTGQNISAGTYLNTAGSRTTFVNTSGSGLSLHPGTATCPTGSGNGGLHFTAPANVVRLDGNIDVNALHNANLVQNSQTTFISNGQHIQGFTYYNAPGGQTTLNYMGPGTLSINGNQVGVLTQTASGPVLQIAGQLNTIFSQNYTPYYAGHGGSIIGDVNYLSSYSGYLVASAPPNSSQGSVTSPILGSHSNTHVNVSSLLLGPAGVHAGQVHSGLGQLGNNVNPGASGMPSIASVVDMNGKVVGKYDASLIAIKGGLINLEGISIANGVKKQEVAGMGSVSLLAHEQPHAAGTETLGDTSQGEALRSNLVAGKSPVKLGDRQWLSLETGIAGKTH